MKELTNLVTSNYLFNTFDQLRGLALKSLKHSIIVASYNAIKLCNNHCDPLISYINLHKMTNTATHSVYSSYKCALLLNKTCNETTTSNGWIHLSFDVIKTSRESLFLFKRSNKTKFGMNATYTKFVHLNGKLLLIWPNLT
jgi:hypothetical protein